MCKRQEEEEGAYGYQTQEGIHHKQWGGGELGRYSTGGHRQPYGLDVILSRMTDYPICWLGTPGFAQSTPLRDSW